MKTPPATASEVLRGMHVESVPVRLRTAADPQAEMRMPAPDAVAQAQEAALRARFDEAASAGREEGFRSGYADGMREGQAEAARRVQAAVDDAVKQATGPLQEEQERLRAVMLGLARLPEECLLASEDEMIALCFDAVCRMVGASAASEEGVARQVRHLLSLARPGEHVVLHMHPQDAELLQASAGGQGMAVVADEEVAVGGAIVRGPSGSLDARLDNMLESCKATLLAARAQRRAAASGGAP